MQTTFGGSVYGVDLGLPAPGPLVSAFSPGSGAAGAKVLLTGEQFLGAMAVSFHGALAQFEVLSAHSIVAVVPAAATSGAISVTTPNGTAASANSFKVLAP